MTEKNTPAITDTSGMPAAAIVIHAENMTIKYYDKKNPRREPLIDGLSFELHAKEWLALCGVPESGKTSLLLALAGLREYWDGEASIFGIPLADRKQRYKSHLGIVTQQDSLAGKLTVGENIDFVAALFAADRHRKAFHEHKQLLIETLGLADILGRRFETIGRSDKRRAMTAAALIHDPDLLLLDEVFSQIEESSIEMILQLLKIQQDKGMAVLSTCTPALPDPADKLILLGKPKEVKPS